MSLTGKIMVFLIMIFSLVFMAFSVMTYATHRNWREVVENTELKANKPLGLRKQLENLRAENDDYQGRLGDLEGQIEKLKGEKDSNIAKMNSIVTTMTAKNQALQKEKDDLEKSQREAVATMEMLQTTNGAMRDELGKAREEILAAHRSRDKHMQDVAKLTDELGQNQNELTRLQSRQVQLSEQLVKQQQLIAYHGLLENSPENIQSPPRVEGRIMGINSADKLVEISIGSDDGVLVGHQLEVFRLGTTPRYLGRVQIIRTGPDRAVAKVVPGTMKGAFERNDHVATKLR